MRRVRWVAGRLVLAPVFAAAYGWQDRLRSLPGPRVALVLPLQEPSHQASAALAALVIVWLAAFAIAAVVAPIRVLPGWLAALIRGTAAFALIVTLQAVSIQLVRQAALGFAWHAALADATPFVAAGCAVVATALVRALDRPGRVAVRLALPPRQRVA